MTARVPAIGATAKKVNDVLNLLAVEARIGHEDMNIGDEELGSGCGSRPPAWRMLSGLWHARKGCFSTRSTAERHLRA